MAAPKPSPANGSTEVSQVPAPAAPFHLDDRDVRLEVLRHSLVRNGNMNGEKVVVDAKLFYEFVTGDAS